VVLAGEAVDPRRCDRELHLRFESITAWVELYKLGNLRKRPAKLHADKGYDYAHLRRDLQRGGITPRIAHRGVDSSERLGCARWVVERTRAWGMTCRKLAVRYDRHAASVPAFLYLACTFTPVHILAHAEEQAD
jgi:IS5 family transposase